MGFMRYGKWKQGQFLLSTQAALTQQATVSKGAAGKGHGPRKKAKVPAAERQGQPTEQRDHVRRLMSMASAAVGSGSQQELQVLDEERRLKAERTPVERGGPPIDDREEDSIM